jgi:flagellar biosynthesis protein FlhB
MASDDGQDDRTEAASAKRLEEARRQGQIPMARDLALVASLTAVFAVLVAKGPAFRDALVALVRASAGSVDRARPVELLPLLATPGALAALTVLAAAVAAIAAGVVQTRGGFWLELAMPDASRLFDPKRLTRLARREGLADLGAAVVKNLAIGGVLWLCLRAELLTLPHLLHADPGAALGSLFAPFRAGAAKIMAILVLIAGADLALTRWRFGRQMRMSREELKREYRDDEGDPLIRARRKKKHRELVKGRVRVEVPRADVLLVNPTHIAIALRYRSGEDRAPRVTAKGKGAAAEAMRALAREHGIPIVEDVPLARLLWKRVRVGRNVPADTYKAVAAVLAVVYRMGGRRGAEEAR